VGALNIATAGAIGGPGLLTASADASWVGGIASAVWTAPFAGTFTMTALEPLLYVAFGSHDLRFGLRARVDAALHQALAKRDDAVRRLRHRCVCIQPVPGITYLLDLTLTSDASAGFRGPGFGDASSFGPTTFTSVVPLPAPWLLLLAGLGPLIAGKRAARAA